MSTSMTASCSACIQRVLPIASSASVPALLYCYITGKVSFGITGWRRSKEMAWHGMAWHGRGAQGRCRQAFAMSRRAAVKREEEKGGRREGEERRREEQERRSRAWSGSRLDGSEEGRSQDIVIVDAGRCCVDRAEPSCDLPPAIRKRWTVVLAVFLASMDNTCMVLYMVLYMVL